MVFTREGFPSAECIFRHGEVALKLYIVQTGIIGCEGRVLRSGSMVGEDMITQNGRRVSMATALTFADMQASSLLRNRLSHAKPPAPSPLPVPCPPRLCGPLRCTSLATVATYGALTRMPMLPALLLAAIQRRF